MKTKPEVANPKVPEIPNWTANLLYSVVYYITNVQKSNWISNGVKIRDIAKFKNEEEVLFQPFSFYLVSKVEINDKNYTANIYLKST